MSFCECKTEYSLEEHGEGWALYLGRCNHRHGYNIANIEEIDLARMRDMVERANRGL